MLALAGDVRDSAHIESAFTRVEDEFGPLDVLVCSAGITGDSLRTVDVGDDEWRRVLAINADGVFFCNRAAVARMEPRGYGAACPDERGARPLHDRQDPDATVGEAR